MEPRDKNHPQPGQSQERILRDRRHQSPIDYENVPDPVSFEDDDLDGEERDDPENDNKDDVKDNR